jgi:hypothetical protein
MGAFAWQLRCRAHAPTYYNEANLDNHAVVLGPNLRIVNFAFPHRRKAAKRKGGDGSPHL